MQALKEAQAAKAEAEQDADMLERQLQQANADKADSKPQATAPPETSPALRRSLSPRRQPSSNLQVCTNMQPESTDPTFDLCLGHFRICFSCCHQIL